jgi:hypothetical protein
MAKKPSFWTESIEHGEGWHQSAELRLDHPQLFQVERRHRRLVLHLAPQVPVLRDHLWLQVSVIPQLRALKRKQLRNLRHALLLS